MGSCSEEALNLGVEISLAAALITESFMNFQRNSGLVSTVVYPPILLTVRVITALSQSFCS